MVIDRIRRVATWAGLCGALALVAPVGAASARTHGEPTPLTVTPQLAERLAPAATKTASAGLVEVAQTNQQIRRQRAADRRQFRRQRTVNRRQFRRQRAADRRQVRRQQNVRRYDDRIYRNGRWYYRRGDRWYDNTGAAVAAGIIGLAAGAIAGSAVAGQQRTVVIEDDYRGVPAPYTAEWYRRCDMKYRSFRASDGTYLGYDGLRHTCRLP